MSAKHAVALALLTVAVTACDQPPTAVPQAPSSAHGLPERTR